MISYDNILEQFIFGYRVLTADPVGVCKDEALDSINEALQKDYKRTHLDNWIAGRKVTPGNVLKYCGEWILKKEMEIQPGANKGVGYDSVIVDGVEYVRK